MANYEEKKVYYIPAFVERIDELGNYPVKVSFPIGEERLAVQLEDLPDLMFTAEEVAKENDLYTSLHGEVVVVTENKELKEKVASLQEENCNLTAWYKEANKTASEAADANDELKAKIAELKARNTELEAMLKEVTATRDEAVKQNNELDSVNKEQAEKIRKLGEALSDYKHMNNKLQAENTNLTFLLEDAPEKEATKTLHVTLNDGTEIEFRRYTDYQYRTDVDMFVVKDGEKHIAGFMRGDSPTNIAYWW